MFHWVYDIPSWAFCTLVVSACVLFGVGGLVLTRPLARRIVGPPPGINDIVGNIVQAAGAFYGITLGLIAVGAWQTFGETDMRVLHEAASLGSPGLENIRWTHPVYPGDTLHLRLTVLESRPLASRPTVGLVRSSWNVINQDDVTVLTMEGWGFFGRRSAATS